MSPHSRSSWGEWVSTTRWGLRSASRRLAPDSTDASARSTPTLIRSGANARACLGVALEGKHRRGAHACKQQRVVAVVGADVVAAHPRAAQAAQMRHQLVLVQPEPEVERGVSLELESQPA